MDRCPGHSKQTGNPCKRSAGWGTDHPGYGLCKFHGGASPNGKKNAQRKQAEQAVATYGLPREVDPHSALLEELHRTAGHVAWLQLKVAELDHENTYGPVGAAKHPEAKPHVWIVMYRDERRHLESVARTCVQVGIEERRIQLAEQQGMLIAKAIDGILSELGVRDRPEVPSVVRRHLTLLDGGAQAA